MLRWPLRILTAVSLLVCLASVVVWVRSWFITDHFLWLRKDDVGDQRYNWFLAVSTGRGGIGVCRDAEVYASRHHLAPAEADAPTGHWHFDGHQKLSPRYPASPFYTSPPDPPAFRFVWSDDPATVTRDVVLPLWAIALPTALLPAASLLRHRRRRRARLRRTRGLCPTCGYDLRATSGRCPECGAVPTIAPGTRHG